MDFGCLSGSVRNVDQNAPFVGNGAVAADEAAIYREFIVPVVAVERLRRFGILRLARRLADGYIDRAQRDFSAAGKQI